MALVAVIKDGKWVPVDGDGYPLITQTTDTRAIEANPIDIIMANLAAVVRLAQGLSPEDARRVRDFVHATSAMLQATTYLEASDQKLLEAALRDTARKI